jgi:hypothetical protein
MVKSYKAINFGVLWIFTEFWVLFMGSPYDLPTFLLN